MTSYLPSMQAGEKLEQFIARTLLPPEDFRRRMNSVISSTAEHLKHMPGYNVKEVVKSGSLGKGTSVGTTADADLVLFLNGYTTMESLVELKPKILADITKHMLQLDPCQYTCNVIKRTAYHIEFIIKFRGTGESVRVDVLPALDVVANNGGSVDRVYEEMKQKNKVVRSHYSVCFCKKQLDLIGHQPAKVKDLIRLLKYWKNENNLYLKSYCCEVLVLHTCEQYGIGERFDMKQAFQCVLDVLIEVDHFHLHIDRLFYFNNKDWNSVFPNSQDGARIKDCARRTKNVL